MSKMRTDFDVLIVGGGMVGASLAIALSEHQLAHWFVGSSDSI